MRDSCSGNVESHAKVTACPRKNNVARSNATTKRVLRQCRVDRVIIYWVEFAGQCDSY